MHKPTVLERDIEEALSRLRSAEPALGTFCTVAMNIARTEGPDQALTYMLGAGDALAAVICPTTRHLRETLGSIRQCRSAIKAMCRK